MEDNAALKIAKALLFVAGAIVILPVMLIAKLLELSD